MRPRTHKPRRVFSRLKLFPATKLLTSVALEILRPLLRIQRNNLYLLVITDRFSKLTLTVTMQNITACDFERAFTAHWMFVYGTITSLLIDNSKQMASKFFTHICQILGVKNLFTTTYHPQINGQADKFNRTICSALRKYIVDHPTDWYLFTPVLTFEYNRQPHTCTGITQFYLVLFKPVPLLLTENLYPKPYTHTTVDQNIGNPNAVC